MKIRFESDDNLPLGKILSIPGMITVVRSVLQEGNKYYPKVCFHEYVYKFVNKLYNTCSFCKIYIVLLVIFFMRSTSTSSALIFNGTQKGQY